jgi:hypothetical protein
VTCTKRKRSEEEQDKDMAIQLIHFMKKPRINRSLVLYSERLVGQLTVLQGIRMKASSMTWCYMRFIKRFFTECGWSHAVPCEALIRKELIKYEIPYQSGYVDHPDKTKEHIGWVHIQIDEFWNTITKLAKLRYSAGQLLLYGPIKIMMN